jgi:hypothetical protein
MKPGVTPLTLSSSKGERVEALLEIGKTLSDRH